MKQGPLKSPWVGEKQSPCSPSTTGGDTSTTPHCAPELEQAPLTPTLKSWGSPSPGGREHMGTPAPWSTLAQPQAPPGPCCTPQDPHVPKESTYQGAAQPAMAVTTCPPCVTLSPLLSLSPPISLSAVPLSCSLPSHVPVLPYPTSLRPLVPIFPVSIKYHPHPQMFCLCTLIFPCAWLNCVLPKMISQPLQVHFSAVIYPNCENFFPSIYLEFPFLQLVLVISHPLLCT